MKPGTDSAALATDRLTLRRVTIDDAEFMLQLLNEPSFIQNIGDKNVRTLGDARAYIESGPLVSYKKSGFGLLVVEVNSAGRPAGVCGLLKRDTLEDVDIGYAFLPEFWSKGYALESATAVMSHAFSSLGMRRILAITNPENQRSIRVLEKLGFQYQRTIRIGDDARETKVFAKSSV